MSDMTEIEKRLDNVNQKLEKEIKKRKTTMTISIVGGIIIIIAMFLYFGWIKNQIQQAIQPEDVARMASQEIRRRIPDMRVKLTESLKQEAPQLAKNAKIEIQRSIPEFRVYLESQIKSKTGGALSNFVGEFDRMVSETLKDNKLLIARFIKDVQDPVKKEQLEEDLYNSLVEHFNQPYVKSDIDSYTQVINNLDKKISYLYIGQNLTEEEKLVLDIIYGMREMAKRGSEFDVEAEIKTFGRTGK